METTLQVVAIHTIQQPEATFGAPRSQTYAPLYDSDEHE